MDIQDTLVFPETAPRGAWASEYFGSIHTTLRLARGCNLTTVVCRGFRCHPKWCIYKWAPCCLYTYIPERRTRPVGLFPTKGVLRIAPRGTISLHRSPQRRACPLLTGVPFGRNNYIHQGGLAPTTRGRTSRPPPESSEVRCTEGWPINPCTAVVAVVRRIQLSICRLARSRCPSS